MLPLLASVKVTVPVGVPLAELTVAVNLTHASRLIDAADAASEVDVAINPGGRAAAHTAGSKRPVATTARKLTSVREPQIMAATLTFPGE